MRKTIWNATGFVAYGVLFAVAALVGVKYTMPSLHYDIPVIGTPAIDDGIEYRGLLDPTGNGSAQEWSISDYIHVDDGVWQTAETTWTSVPIANDCNRCHVRGWGLVL
jgi:hypothetical protein